MFCQIELHFLVNAAIVWFIVLLDYSLEFIFFFFHTLFLYLACHFLQNLVGESMLPMLAKESLKALGGLGLLSLGGKFLLRRVFEVCIESFTQENLLGLIVLR